MTGLLIGSAVRVYRGRWQPLPEMDEDEAVIAKIVALPDTKGNREENTGPLKIPVNTATDEMLQRIPGVGPVMARRILAYRQNSGKFHSTEDLLKVKGIGPRTLEKMRPYIIMEEYKSLDKESK